MKVRVVYDPILRRETKPVLEFGQPLKKTADGMRRLMHQRQGMGLAANQIGLDQQLLVIERKQIKDDSLPGIAFLALANPKISRVGRETNVVNEGCLSLPGLELPVRRPISVVVDGQNADGKKVKIKAKGLLARILQHEVDHLQGRLFTDRVEPNVREKLTNYTWAKIVFFGSDTFSLTILQDLRRAGANILAVVTESDKPAGRQRRSKPTVVKAYAIQEGIAVFTPENKSDITEVIENLAPELIILASYGKILPAEALLIPTYGALNLHPSLLPKFRGPTPIQSAILAGEKVTGVSLIRMSAEVDAGELVACREIALLPTDTTVALKEKLAILAAELIKGELPSYLSGRSRLVAQNSSAVTSTAKLTKEMALINWSEDLRTVDRKIRAYNPWPKAYTFLGDKRLIFLESGWDSGRLVIKKVQLEGKKPALWSDFQTGHRKELTKTDWLAKIT